MGVTTIPAMKDAFSRQHAVALVAQIAEKYPDHTAYPHAWGNDWGVTISAPIGADEALEMETTVRSLIYLGLT